MALKHCVFILLQMFQRAIVLGFLIKRLYIEDCRKIILGSVEPCQWVQNSVCVCVCVHFLEESIAFIYFHILYHKKVKNH